MRNQPYPLYEVEPLNDLKELVRHTAEKYGDKPAFIFERDKETVSVSYRQFKSDVDALGTAFLDMGLRNAKIALFGDNSYEWLLTYFATVNSGNVIIPLDKYLTGPEIMNLIDHSGAEVFVFSDVYVDMAAFLQENGADIWHYFAVSELYKLVKKGTTFIQDGDKRMVEYQIDRNAMSTLMYTSGTTGSPKGVMLTHKGITTNVLGILQNVYLWESTLLVCPLYHGSGFAGTVGMLISGCSVAINNSMKNLPNDFAKYKPRVIILVPLFIETFYKQIVAAAGGSKDKGILRAVSDRVFGGNLEIIVSGGAPLEGKLVEAYAELGITVLNAYGLTENSAIISINRNNYLKADSVGSLLPNCEVKISNPDENGNGEVLTKSEYVMLGYFKNEQATKDTFDGEWLKTGDIGYFDQDGFLYISGRKKNMILMSDGKNVYPEELEFTLQKHIPYIKEVVIYAENNLIVAEVFLDSENQPSCATQLEGDIAAFNKTQALFKNISKTVIRDTEFPKTTTKKIKRQYL